MRTASKPGAAAAARGGAAYSLPAVAPVRSSTRHAAAATTPQAATAAKKPAAKPVQKLPALKAKPGSSPPQRVSTVAPRAAAVPLRRTTEDERKERVAALFSRYAAAGEESRSKLSEPGPAETTLGNVSDHPTFYQLVTGTVEQSGEVIGVEGIMALAGDLRVDPNALLMLVMAWQFDVAVMGEITNAEFTAGMKKLRCVTVKELRASLDKALQSVQESPDVFRKFYGFVFDFGKETPEAKVIDVTIACSLLQLVMELHPEYVERTNLFIMFLSLPDSTCKALNKDQWQCWLVFLAEVRKMSEYDAASSFPLLFDDFVDWAKTHGTIQ
eukprot:TRINITY_DN3417_c0_g1_i2.p1 TRINITY_DN3417_c0_g1~~TRINITY_DN3417_c0_g1_i2.p1  ORF type:complete len:328 (-),score=95.91 TRINITY_DN3417_c0_g1_i2:58-1041(-)